MIRDGACLAFLVERQSLRVKIFDDFLRRVVLLDLAVKVEADHVARVDLARQFEELCQALLFCLFYVLRRHANDEVHVDVVVVFLIVLSGDSASLVVTMADKGFYAP
jgi:hypothetical protein